MICLGELRVAGCTWFGAGHARLGAVQNCLNVGLSPNLLHFDEALFEEANPEAPII